MVIFTISMVIFYKSTIQYFHPMHFPPKVPERSAQVKGARMPLLMCGAAGISPSMTVPVCEVEKSSIFNKE